MHMTEVVAIATINADPTTAAIITMVVLKLIFMLSPVMVRVGTGCEVALSGPFSWEASWKDITLGVTVVLGGVLCDSEEVIMVVLGSSVTIDTEFVGSTAAQLRSAFSSVV